MEKLMGFKIKVVERAGTPIKDLFSPTNVWGGGQCERLDCTTCQQGLEEIPDCTRRNIVYESICTKCQPEAKKPGSLDYHEKTKTPSIYVGETSRSIYERAGEHWAGYKKRKTDSHIWKHHLLHHGSQGEPEMVFKVLGQFKSALTRQVTEAVQIRKRGTLALNSKAEFDRCRIHRLTVDQQDDGRTQWCESEDGRHQDGSLGEQYMIEKRKKMDKEAKKSMGAPIITNSSKRKVQNEASGRPEKRRKYVLVDKDWGHRSSNKGLDCLIRDQCKEPTEGGYKESQDL